MPVDQNIQRFYKIAQDRDFSRDFLFRVTQMQLQGVPALRDDELVYVKTASLPGRSISDVPVPYMGLDFHVPGSVKYTGSEGYSLTFYLDGQSTLRNYFETASRNLFDDQSSTGAYGTPGLENYLILEQLDKQLNTVPNGSYKLIGTSIRNIDKIDYSIAAGTGSTVDITVSIAYHYYIQT
jgi:hypothetical protein